MNTPNKKGYCRLGPKSGPTRLVHRLVYQEIHGPIPDGLMVLHSCDNPSCINPDHLRVGTNEENMEERNRKNRQAKLRGVMNGMAKMSEDTARMIKSLKGNPRKYGDISSIAKRFQVTIGQAKGILYGKSWRHISV